MINMAHNGRFIYVENAIFSAIQQKHRPENYKCQSGAQGIVEE